MSQPHLRGPPDHQRHRRRPEKHWLTPELIKVTLRLFGDNHLLLGLQRK